jgi:hypothetical protein
MSLHIHRVPTHLVSSKPDGQPRWCFYCRKRVNFIREIHAPDDKMSYYGPHAVIRCDHGHHDGDLFPGRFREWE